MVFKGLLILVGIFVLGILVLIHELGHFLAAKWFGIRVLAFSIGFGRPILTRTIGRTEYRLGSIPFGGYVHMAGEHPEEARTPAEHDFTAKPVWQRACVALAGPLANLVSAVAFLWLMYLTGVQREAYLDNPVIGAVSDSSVAWQAGLLAGDTVVAINGKTIDSWEGISQTLSLRERSYSVEVARTGGRVRVSLAVPQDGSGSVLEDPTLGLHPTIPARIGQVFSGSAAETAGLLPGDRIVSINGTVITSWNQVPHIVTRFTEEQPPLRIALQRGNDVVTLYAKPVFRSDENRMLLGIAVSSPRARTIRFGPVSALVKAGAKSLEYAGMIFTVLDKMISRRISPRQLSGPVTIIQVSGIAALGGPAALLNFMAFIGVQLGVINLFPLLITDGGMIAFLVLEALRGKPLSAKYQIIINRVAIALFTLLFVIITFNDLRRVPLLFQLMGG